MRKKICFCLALVMLLSTMSMLVSAVDFSSFVTETSELGIIEPKAYSTATLEEDFADDTVLVVLNNKASLNFKDYTVSDFKEAKCAAVSDLSTAKKKQVEEKVKDFNNTARTMSAEDKAAAVEEINQYNQILCLELADKGKENVLAAIKALEARDDVKYAEPDYIMSLCSTTYNDPYLDQQWAIEEIALDKAWDITKGSINVYVGILDSGIDASHPELQGKIASPLCADFNNGNMYSVPLDSSGHGTHVAGIIAAAMNNQGISGAASNVRIVALRVVHHDNSIFFSNVTAALNYAEEMEIPILNLSAGMDQESAVYPETLEDAIENYSGLLICAAGNDSSDNDDPDVAFYPASIDLDNILAVGASTEDSEKWEKSGYGSTSVDVFAPGYDILSCYPTARCANESCTSGLSAYNRHHANGYHFDSGTSMAAPYVTAIAALMLSENPDLTPLQIKNKIIETCTYVEELEDQCVGQGVVNAYAALLKAYSVTTMNVYSSRNVNMTSGRQYWVKITIPRSGHYEFTTTGSLHTVGALYSPTRGLIARSSNANSTTSSNFSIDQYLSQGETVYLRISVKGTPGSGNITLYVT